MLLGSQRVRHNLVTEQQQQRAKTIMRKPLKLKKQKNEFDFEKGEKRNIGKQNKCYTYEIKQKSSNSRISDWEGSFLSN